jgi:hypothetical protein
MPYRDKETLTDELKALRDILKQNNKIVLDKLKKVEQELKNKGKKKPVSGNPKPKPKKKAK